MEESPRPMMNGYGPLARGLHRIMAALLLAVMFGLALGSSLRESPTFDEGGYIARGWAFLRTGTLIPLGHPPLTNILSGIGLLLEPGLPDPRSLDGWEESNAEKVSEDLLWHSGANAARIVFLARLPILWLALLFGALTYRWARETYGRWSAMLALLLFAFSPNILAHSGLATTDLGVAAFYVATLYAWVRFLRDPSARWLAISGVLFGLAQASKFSALALIPTLAILTWWHTLLRGPLMVRPSRRLTRQGLRRTVLPRLFGWLGKGPVPRWTTALAALLLMGLIGLAALWASYLFSLQPDAFGIRYPLSAYVAEFTHFLGLASGGHRAYLLGRFSELGWWWYHPLTLVFKMTLPELTLFAIAITLAAGREMRKQEWELLVPALLYLGFSMISTLNVGVRYLLPTLPLLFIFAARIGYGPLKTGWLRPVVLSTLGAAQIIAALWRYPYYIAFFNEGVGGPDNGINLLADSNLDWGQDLPGLADYLRQRGASDPIYLSYFGQAEPAYYGINYVALPGWPPPPPDPFRPPFYPLRPAPGLYAISASNLIGMQMHDPDAFGYFRTRRPAAVIGHSIYVYEVIPEAVPADAPPWFAQCTTPDLDPAESWPALFEMTGQGSLRAVYFDCTNALPFRSGPGWVLVQEGLEPIVDLGEPTYLARNSDGAPRYRVWRITSPPPAPPSTIQFPSASLPLPIAGIVELLGYQVFYPEPRPGDLVVVHGWWRVREAPPAEVSIFAHLLNPDDSLLSSGDALGVFPQSWEPGMVFVQQHRFIIPEGTPPGSYTLALGLYRLDTGERFPVAQSGDRVVDRIVLRTIQVGEP